jgi:hypothetical protein
LNDTLAAGNIVQTDVPLFIESPFPNTAIGQTYPVWFIREDVIFVVEELHFEPA